MSGTWRLRGATAPTERLGTRKLARYQGTQAQTEMGQFVMLYMDAPHHTRLRKIISRGFTPRAIGRLRDELNERAQRIAKAAADSGVALRPIPDYDAYREGCGRDLILGKVWKPVG